MEGKDPRPIGSLVLLTAGHQVPVDVHPTELQERVDSRRISNDRRKLLRLRSSANPDFVGYIDALEVVGILPRRIDVPHPQIANQVGDEAGQ